MISLPRSSLIVLVAVLACLGFSGRCAGEAAPVPAFLPLTLTIIPTGTDKDHASLELYLKAETHFHVVLHNVSSGPVVLWREWCSWGWFNLSFRMTDSSGTSRTIVKKQRPWDRNFPDPVTIAPNGDWVIDVSFSPEEWELPPQLLVAGLHPISLQAIYCSGNNGAGQGAWVGTVVSEKQSYDLWR